MTDRSEPAAELVAVRTACALADRSDLGRLLGTGPDLLGLLHRLSTGDLKDLGPGEGRPTVLTSPKGRIVERLFVHRLERAGVLLVAGPGSAQRVLAHLAKYTFAEKTGLADTTADTFAFAILGPRWQDASRAAGLPELPAYGAASAAVAGADVHVLCTNGFDARGVLVVGDRSAAGPVRRALAQAVASAGGSAIGAETLEAWRVLEGLPASGTELTEEHNPLEAGLRDAVSFTKGCYVGQEVVARLNTYGKVAREIVRLELEPGAPPPAPGAVVRCDGREVGVVTSAVAPADRTTVVALAYVKSREVPPGAPTLAVDDGGTVRAATRL